MCWNGKVDDWHITKTPKKVYKVLERKPKSWAWYDKDFVLKYRSPFMGFMYLKDKEYSKKIEVYHKIPLSDEIEIYRGIHAYSMENCKLVRQPYCIEMLTVVDSSGNAIIRYNNTTYGPTNELEETVVVECTIPEGTTYYENERGEIVTEKLIINREVKI